MIASLLLATILSDHAAAMAASKLTYVAAGHELKEAVNPPSCLESRADQRVVVVNGHKEYAPWPANKELQKHLDAGYAALRAKKIDVGDKEAQAAIAIDNNDARVWLLRAAASIDNNAMLEAKLAARNATKLAPWLAYPHILAAIADFSLLEYDDAVNEFAEELTYNPQSLVWHDVFMKLLKTGAFKMHAYPFWPPRGLVGVAHRGKVEIYDDPEWRAYANCKAVWRYEDAYRRARRGVDGPYEWTLAEERECVTAYVLGNLEIAKKTLPADASNRDVINALPPLAQHILAATDAGLLDGYVTYSVIGQRCPSAVPLLPDDVLAKERAYIRRFIVTPP